MESAFYGCIPCDWTWIDTLWTLCCWPRWGLTPNLDPSFLFPKDKQDSGWTSCHWLCSSMKSSHWWCCGRSESQSELGLCRKRKQLSQSQSPSPLHHPFGCLDKPISRTINAFDTWIWFDKVSNNKVGNSTNQNQSKKLFLASQFAVRLMKMMPTFSMDIIVLFIFNVINIPMEGLTSC